MQPHSAVPLLLLAIALVGNNQSAWACQEPVDEMKVIGRVSELELALSSDDLTVRDAAEKELLALGPVALDYLPPVSPGQTTDVQQRLLRVRTELERQAVVAVSHPTKVSLAGQKSLNDVLAAIGKQTGNEIVLAGTVQADKPDQMIATDWKDAEFWTVMNDLQQRAGLEIDPYVSEPDQLALVEDVRVAAGVQAPALPCHGSSSVLSFDLMRADAVRNFANPQTSGINLQLRLRWEPRLRPISLELPMSSITIVDEFDKQHPIEMVDQTIGTMIQPEIPQSDIYIPLPLVERQIETIKSLKGTFEVTVPGRIETFEFKNLLKTPDGTSQTRAGAKVTFEGISENLDLKVLKMSLSFDQPNGGMESHLGWAYGNRVFLRTADGKEIEPIGTETWQQAEFLLGVSYLFEEIPEGADLVYRTPAAIVKLQVPFELKKIPLP